ncbi:MAG: restriction endonuclease [Oculatellaceae cyanobacterium bins.114]|nr:restriction endonuclease [Oculatellaceae cyanobacterium bins.114]
MSDLASIEKLKLEKLLEMESGYVLDFSNFTFKEFILENLNIDIYDEKYNYRSGSKANRLRGFWVEEPNFIVGNLLEKLLEYWKTKKLIAGKAITPEDEMLFNECQKIVERLKGDPVKQKSEEIKNQEEFSFIRANLLLEFDRFALLEKAEDKRQRGFLLEDLLNRFFSLYEIPTQKSFKRNEGGEQIDGAFKLDGWYYLVECKWTENLTDIRQLDSLYGKVNRSGRQTLGLFLSVNGWSKNVCPLLKQNNDKSIILMDGFDLRSVLVEENNLHLRDLLLKKLEHLNFEGEPFYSANLLLRDI